MQKIGFYPEIKPRQDDFGLQSVKIGEGIAVGRCVFPTSKYRPGDGDLIRIGWLEGKLYDCNLNVLLNSAEK